MKARRSYTRHGLTAPMARIKLRGFQAIDRRSAGARVMLAFREDLVRDLGGEGRLSTQELTLVHMAARARALLDHVDAWIFAQPSLVNGRTRSLLPVLKERQALADHLARLLGQLGLGRRSKDVHESLSEYLALRGQERPADAPVPTPAEGAQADALAGGEPREQEAL